MVDTRVNGGVQNVDLSGGTKGAFWTIAGATIANVLQNGRNGNGGLLDGIIGGGCGNGCGNAGAAAMAAQQVAALQSELATLRAEKYSDNAAKEASDRLLTQWLKPYGDEIANAKVREARMQAEIDCVKETGKLREEILRKDIQLVKQEAACCCAQNANAIATVAAKVDAITGVYVPNSALQPGVPTVQVIHPTTTTTGA